MIPSHLRSGLVLSLLALASSTACSSDPAPQVDVGGGDDSVPNADAQLTALGIGDDEPVADEAMSEDELLTAAWPESDEDVPGDDDLMDTVDTPDDLPEILPDPPMTDIAEQGDGSGISLLADPTWWSQQYSCPRNPLHASCTCRGSMYNCQFANNQPGRNRYLPPRAIRALRGTSDKKARKAIIENLGRWDLTAGNQLYDGSGTPRGEVKGGCFDDAQNGVDKGHPCVKINFGQLKKMTVAGSTTKKQYVYAFDTNRGSGWVEAAGITDSAFKRYDLPPRSASSFATTSYVAKSAEDYNCKPANYDSTACLPKWAQLKIRPKSGPKVSEKARDYMLRDGNVLNLAYQTPLVGGAATDTFLVSASTLAFKRVKSTANRKSILRISLYETMDKDHGGTKVVGKMYFVFGEIAGRFGWVAADAVKKGSVATAGSGTDTCVGKQDGLYCSQINPGAYECKNGSIASGQYCVAPAKCVGPNGPGTTIQCR